MKHTTTEEDRFLEDLEMILHRNYFDEIEQMVERLDDRIEDLLNENETYKEERERLLEEIKDLKSALDEANIEIESLQEREF